MNKPSRRRGTWKTFYEHALSPRLGTVLRPRYWVPSACLGIGVLLGSLFLDTPGPRSVSLVVVSYSSIALGFTVTAITVLTGLPEQGFLRTLASIGLHREPESESGPPSERSSAFTELVFVFVIAALGHLALTVIVLFIEFGSAILGDFIPLREVAVPVAWGVLALAVSYSLHRFFISVATLHQFLDSRRIWSLWSEYLVCEVIGTETPSTTYYRISLPTSVPAKLYGHGIDLSNWVIANTKGWRTVLPWGTHLAPGQAATVRSGTGEDVASGEGLLVEDERGESTVEFLLYNRDGVPVQRFRRLET